MTPPMPMDQPEKRPIVMPSQGVHLILDKKFLPGNNALMIPKTSDGRVLFAVPWHDKVVLGTTDTPVEEYSLEPVAFEEEVEDEDVMPEMIEGFKQEESVSESEPEPEQEESGNVEAVTPEPEKPKTVKSQSKPKGNFPIQTELNF